MGAAVKKNIVNTSILISIVFVFFPGPAEFARAAADELDFETHKETLKH